MLDVEEVRRLNGLCAMQAADLADRVQRMLGHVRDDGSMLGAGYDFGKGEGLAKGQLQADIVKLRRDLLALWKEVNLL